MNVKNSVIASKNRMLNALAAAQKKFVSGVTGQSTTSMPWKFDVLCLRNSMAPGYTTSGQQGGRLWYSPISVHALHADSACTTPRLYQSMLCKVSGSTQTVDRLS